VLKDEIARLWRGRTEQLVLVDGSGAVDIIEQKRLFAFLELLRRKLHLPGRAPFTSCTAVVSWHAVYVRRIQTFKPPLLAPAFLRGMAH
jgi:hypothetical protein